MKVARYDQVYDGETVVITGRQHKISCCDCGLVHHLKFRLRGSTITYKASRDNRATAARRRGKQFNQE